jgi:hypothetical protein
MTGDGPPPAFLTTEWLLSQFARDRERAHAAFADFVRFRLAA